MIDSPGNNMYGYVETTSCSDQSSAGSDERSLNRDYKQENRNKASFL